MLTASSCRRVSRTSKISSAVSALSLGGSGVQRWKSTCVVAQFRSVSTQRSWCGVGFRRTMKKIDTPLSMNGMMSVASGCSEAISNSTERRKRRSCRKQHTCNQAAVRVRVRVGVRGRVRDIRTLQVVRGGRLAYYPMLGGHLAPMRLGPSG